jgi:hypothetical protein
MLIFSRIFPRFLTSSFKVSGLTLRSLIHLELVSVQGERQGSSFSLLHVDIQSSQYQLLKILQDYYFFTEGENIQGVEKNLSKASYLVNSIIRILTIISKLATALRSLSIGHKPLVRGGLVRMVSFHGNC